MERFLKQYPHVDVKDVEKCDSKAVAAFQRGELTEAHMERLFRFVATNKQISQHGLAQLPPLPSDARKKSVEEGLSFMSVLLHGYAAEPAKEEEEALPEECKEIGLTRQEYAMLKGDYGTILGVSVDKSVYRNLIRKCKTKGALSLRHHEARTKVFMIKKMKALAASRTRAKQHKEIITTINAKANLLIKRVPIYHWCEFLRKNRRGERAPHHVGAGHRHAASVRIKLRASHWRHA